MDRDFATGAISSSRIRTDPRFTIGHHGRVPYVLDRRLPLAARQSFEGGQASWHLEHVSFTWNEVKEFGEISIRVRARGRSRACRFLRSAGSCGSRMTRTGSIPVASSDTLRATRRTHEGRCSLAVVAVRSGSNAIASWASRSRRRSRSFGGSAPAATGRGTTSGRSCGGRRGGEFDRGAIGLGEARSRAEQAHGSRNRHCTLEIVAGSACRAAQ